MRAAEGVARRGHGLARADVPIREAAGGAGSDHRDRIAGKRSHRTAGKRRGEGAIVNLVGHRDGGDGQRTGGDVRDQADRLSDGVITGFRAAEDSARDRDGLGRADIPVRKGARRGRHVHRDGISTERGHRSTGDVRGEAAVVDLVGGGHARERQVARGDVTRRGGKSGDTVTIDGLAARAGAALRHDGRSGSEGDRLAVAGIAGGVGRRGEAEDRRAVAAGVARSDGHHRVGHRGGVGPIVDLGRRGGEGRGQCRREAVEQSLARSLDRGDAVAGVILTEVEGQAAGDVAG